jgi:hypothetical protein
VTGWGNTQLKVHLGRLEELEYLLVHRGGRGQSFVYELLGDGGGENGSLLDASSESPYDANRSGQNGEWSGWWSGPSRAEVGGWSAIGKRGERRENKPKWRGSYCQRRKHHVAGRRFTHAVPTCGQRLGAAHRRCRRARMTRRAKRRAEERIGDTEDPSSMAAWLGTYLE